MNTSERLSWDITWHMVASVIAQRSLCARDQVGAVIVTAQNRIVATGYNGSPAGFEHDNKPCTEWCTRARVGEIIKRTHGLPGFKLNKQYDDCYSLHAEANALSVCDRSVREGGTIYVTSDICFNCAKLIANSGITRVCVTQTNQVHRNVEKSYIFLRECGITVDES